jgi:DNA (cytosine-5)-methyltransferase 1
MLSGQGCAFTFIDLFAGIGGTRLAFQRAGGRCIFSSEWDKYAQKTYEANFGEVPHGDIAEIAESVIPAHDVLVAGFPCQPFSIAGVTKHTALGNHHGFLHRTQGTMFFEAARVIAHHRPRAFMLENVKHLTRHDGGKTFATIIGTLEEELGYHVHPLVIDALGVVPQHRERIYIVGFREPVEFTWPKFKRDRRAIRGVLERRVDNKYTLTDHLWNYLQEYADKHRAKGNGFGYGLVDLNGPTRTLSARYFKDGSEILIPQRAKNPRRLTPRECARLMGFPDSYKIPVSDTQAYKQFGNSVVVPVVEAIAKRIAKTLPTVTLEAEAHTNGAKPRTRQTQRLLSPGPLVPSAR